MSHFSTRLKLPFILESQSQKEVTYNEALEIIDILLHAAVISLGDNIPPGKPKRGDCYVIGDNPKDVWENHARALAYFTNGWNFIEAFEGLTVWVRSSSCHFTYNGSKWLPSLDISSQSISRSAPSDACAGSPKSKAVQLVDACPIVEAK